MKIFVSGGCKNGKSYIAQQWAKNFADANNIPHYYLATMLPRDDEDLKRIERHRKERQNWGFETIEQPRNLGSTFKDHPGADSKGVFLIDSVTAIVAEEMYYNDDGSPITLGPAGHSQETIDKILSKLISDFSIFINAVDHAIFVSDYIYSDTAHFADSVLQYRKMLATIDKLLTSKCDGVCEVVYGIPLMHKDELEAEERKLL